MVRLVSPPPPPPLLPTTTSAPHSQPFPPPSPTSVHHPRPPSSSIPTGGVIPAALASPAPPRRTLRDPQPTRSPPVWRGTPATPSPPPHRSTHPSFRLASAPPPRGSAGAGSFVRTGRDRHAVAGEPAPVDVTLPSIPGWGGAYRSSRSADLRGVTPSNVLTSAQQPLPSTAFLPPSPPPPSQLSDPRFPFPGPHRTSSCLQSSHPRFLVRPPRLRAS